MNACETILKVALHYAKLGWHLTPAYHGADGKCGKHPAVPWKQDAVRNGHAVGPVVDPEKLRAYFLADGRIADICVHTKPSRLVVVDCDRKWKDVIEVVDGTRVTRRVFVDGLANFLEYMGNDPGTALISRSKRGLHFFYRVDSDAAAHIKNGVNVLGLPGVDVRGGGSSSGGVTVEFNGACPHRAWVRGTPRIRKDPGDTEGVIEGIGNYETLTFDAEGNCTAGLPKVEVGALTRTPQAEGIRPLPEKLLRALAARHSGTPTKAAVRQQGEDARKQRSMLIQASPTEKQPLPLSDGKEAASTSVCRAAR